jgi:energy-coupling factor transporter ATP-binding protein EcfA2
MIPYVDSSPCIEELRLTRFKSFRDAVLPLGDLTLLIGRNGSGKSNAIDGLHVLARLAEGEDIVGAIDGSRLGGSEVRGGVRGCAPYGETSFALGCTVLNHGRRLRLDLVVQVEPDVQIVREELWCDDGSGDPRPYLVTEDPQPGLVDIEGRHWNNRPGPNPRVPFRSDRLLTAQIPTKLPATSAAGRDIHAGAIAVLEALRAVFILDPVPALMRQYVPRRDVRLRRQADNVSAVIAGLQDDDTRWSRLREVVQALPEQGVAEIGVESSPLGDVMLSVHERFAGRDVPFPARVMSDGMLRYLAFAAALLEAPEVTDGDDLRATTQLVIEEVENGLHPSQAALIVRLIKEEAGRRRIRTLTTTHSPAMLSALGPDDHEGVIVCRRNPETAVTELVRLVDVPRYPEALAAGSLGDAVTARRLEGTVDVDRRTATLDALLEGF